MTVGRSDDALGLADLDDEWEVLIDREIPPARTGKRESGFGDGQDGCPHLDRGLEARGSGRGPHPER